MHDMLDLHCHLLPGVDDGAADMHEAVGMARILAQTGFGCVAASPHMGEGPGGDASIAAADSVRAALQERLQRDGLALAILPNGEHHISPGLFDRIAQGHVVPIGGGGPWLLVEFPWEGVPTPEEIIFRIQLKGHRLLVAHPERHSFLDAAMLARLVDRGVRLQLDLGSFIGMFGTQVQSRAAQLTEAGLAHVIGTDLHRPEDADAWIPEALSVAARRYGTDALTRATRDNPAAIIGGCGPRDVFPFVDPR